MAINRTGFEQTSTGLQISKDPEAQLIYTFNWGNWLETGDSLSTVAYTVAARRNDPTPPTIVTSGITGNKTFVELSGGVKGKTYIVTAKITTSNNAIDRRNFRLKVEDRVA
tara:strand:- start:2277 stop:2609 length:333 start_codon:yes stop_codon:yes gene_type:complete